MGPPGSRAARAVGVARRGLTRLRGLGGGPRVGALALALLAAVLAYAVARGVFPYHSVNHDEGVYLQQAEMLLAGRLALRPPVAESFRPWFFVADGGRLYPKYAPVTAAMFALGELCCGYRLALSGVAAAVVGLTYAVVAEAFDRHTGLLAAALLVASPLFVVHSGLFLPYAPTAAWNLLFAFAYLRADRTGSRRWAALAGLAVGVAFFARPYTAVLFALPFVAHALWTLARGGDSGGAVSGRADSSTGGGPASLERLDRTALARHLTTAALGMAGVAVALGYNAVVTGSPLVFPYEAFEPRDSLGFGRRALGAYERRYTPDLAVRANATVLARLFGRWVVAGPLGTALAAVGLLAFVGRVRRWIRARRRGPSAATTDDRTSDATTAVEPTAPPSPPVLARRAILAGLFLSVVAGNLYFWGNLNILGNMADPADGLIATVGPVYHFDLLVPTAAFAAVGIRTLGGRARSRIDTRFESDHGRRVGLACLIVGATLFGAVVAGAAAGPVAENRAVSDRLSQAYAPVEDRDLDGGLVFLPTPYGDWLNHPFQALRNDPGFDGPTVYAIRENQFAVVDAYPDRRLYRYTYRGEWRPHTGPPVDPRLQRVDAVRGQRVVVDTELGVPAGAEGVTIVVSAGERHAYYGVQATGEGAGVGDDHGSGAGAGGGNLSFRVVVEDGRASLEGERLEASGNGTVTLAGSQSLRVQALVHHRGGGFEYRLQLPVTREGQETRALTPYLEVCRDPRLCGGEQAYVPRVSPDGVSVTADVRAEDG